MASRLALQSEFYYQLGSPPDSGAHVTATRCEKVALGAGSHGNHYIPAMIGQQQYSPTPTTRVLLLHYPRQSDVPEFLWPWSMSWVSPVRGSQNCTPLSLDPLSTHSPSGVSATLRTKSFNSLEPFRPSGVIADQHPHLPCGLQMSSSTLRSWAVGLTSMIDYRPIPTS